MFYVVEVFLITVKIILSSWIGKWLVHFWHERQRQIKTLPAVALAGWLCKMALIVANICPKTTLELTGRLFSQRKAQMECTLFSDLRCFILTFHEGAEQRAAHGLHWSHPSCCSGHLSCTVLAPSLYSCCCTAAHFQQPQILLLLHHSKDWAKKCNYLFICKIPLWAGKQMIQCLCQHWSY